MKKALFPAFLLVLGSTVLGATVFKEQVAWAAQSVDATIIGPLDADRNIKVHEQGTADVNVTNTSLSVRNPPPVTGGGGSFGMFCPGFHNTPETIIATAVQFSWSGDVGGIILRLRDSIVASFNGPAATGDSGPLVLSLTRPVAFNQVQCVASQQGGVGVSWVGNES